MTILEAIVSAKRRRPCDIPDADMLRWLSKLDGQIHRELISQYDPRVPMPVYNGETDAATEELLMTAPWDEAYIFYLCMRIDLEQEEDELYKKDGELFGTMQQQFYNDYTRRYTRRPTALRF